MEELHLVKKIEICGLFFKDNCFDISFEKDIGIIVAGNGFGKTTVLRLIESFFLKKMIVFRDVIVDSFKVFFSDNTTVSVTQDRSKEIYEISLSLNDNGKEEIRFEERNKDDDGDFYLSRILKPRKEIFAVLPKWFQNMKLQDILFVETERLKLENSQSKARPEEKELLAVENYSEKIKNKISKIRSDSLNNDAKVEDEMTLKLLQNFVNKEMEKKECKPQEIVNLIEIFEKRKTELNNYGLLDETIKKDDDIVSRVLSSSKEKEVEKLFPFIELFYKTRLEKLDFFNGFHERLKLFQNIINKKFNGAKDSQENWFAGKKFSINPSDGFKIEMEMDGRPIPISKLSSGEQQEIVMNYMLLFEKTDNQIVLIDEPEISLHVAWQRLFISDLKKIAAISNAKFIIATHSPDIIDSNWDLVQELKNASK